jgi:hypothetical protein
MSDRAGPAATLLFLEGVEFLACSLALDHAGLVREPIHTGRCWRRLACLAGGISSCPGCGILSEVHVLILELVVGGVQSLSPQFAARRRRRRAVSNGLQQFRRLTQCLLV